MYINRNQLKEAAATILKYCGESVENAELVSESMVRNDSRGITTHGTYLLTPIIDRVNCGQLTLPTTPVVVSDKDGTAVIDGGDGLGAVAGALAVKIAIAKAEQYGVASVLIRNTNNIGSLALYTEAVAQTGKIAIMSCNAAAAMAPWGSGEPFFGTNPIAIAIPAGGDSILSADMASSIVARGKIRKASRNGEKIPNNWALDAEGNITTDPNEALKGALLPIGGPKGSALAMMVDLVSGMLAGASYAPNIKSFHKPEGKTGVGASLIALDISHFIDFQLFEREIVEYIKTIKSLKKAKGVKEIFMPGEIEHNKEKQSICEGVQLDDNAVKTLNSLLEQVSLGFRLS